MKTGAALAGALALVGASASAAAGTVTVEQHGTRNVRVFVPTKVATPTPLVVMLHGCTQTPDDFADATQMDALAEKEGFVVAYPEQPSTTIATRCYQWWDPAHQARDAGEPKDLATAADEVGKAHGVDPERIYVGGISAGAAMSVILGATYPDRFTAIGVIAGVEYKGATSTAEAFSVATSGGPDPDAQGDLAHTAMGSLARVVPTFVMHGTSDGVLAEINGDQVTEQWLRANTLVMGDGAILPAQSVKGDAGYPFTRTVHVDKARGASVIEYYVIEGLGHAWPGGKDGGSYSDAKGPPASALLWGFFKGRTRSAPLDVAPVVLPGATTTLPDGGVVTSDPTASPASAGAPASTSSPAGGGCHVTRDESGAAGLGMAALVGVAMMIARRRARHISRP